MRVLMERKEQSTEWALLFPLRASLFTIKSSMSSKSTLHLIKKEKLNSNERRPRRSSSLSELDKLQSRDILPDVVHSTERTKIHLPNTQIRGSIGDLMNLKKYGGSSCSIRSDTLVARTVPLSTVKSSQSSPWKISCEKVAKELREPLLHEPLTCAQRTLRLSKLIRLQQRTKVFYPLNLSEDTVSVVPKRLFKHRTNYVSDDNSCIFLPH